jgi:hypothetical protein
MHDFEQIKTHPSYARLPLTVREVLRMAFNDPNLDLLAALRGVSPRAARATLDIQLDTLKKLAVSPGCADSDGALDFWFGFACPAWCAGRPSQR